MSIHCQQQDSAAVAMSWQPEDTLIEAAQGGDSAAFDALIRVHQEGVRLHCLRRGLAPEDANDVTQDVFVKVVRNLCRYRHDTAFQTWLYRVTENAIFDHFRGRVRYQAKHEPMPVDDQDRQMDFPSPRHDPERTTHGSLLGARMKEAMQALSPEQRESFLLKELEGMKYEEIAAREGCSVGTIKSRVFRARQILMPMLQDLL